MKPPPDTAIASDVASQALDAQRLLRDVEELRENQARLLESQRQHREAQAIAHLGHWRLDFRNDTLHWSDEVYRILGLEPQQFVATYETFLDYVHPQDRDRVATAYRASIQQRIPYDIEHRVLLKDGSFKYVHERCVNHYDDAGNPFCSIGTIMDITERRLVKDRLRIFMESVENSPAAIGMSTPEGKHYYENKVFDELFGTIGEHPPETLYVDPAVGHEVFKTVMRGGHWTGEVQMYGRDRRNLTIFLRAYASKDSSGQISALVGVHTDITEQKRAEEELRERTDQLRSISAQLTMTEERERQLLAQELHDNLGQQLAAAKIRLSALKTTSKTQQERIDSIVKLIDEAHQSVRQITQAWHPPVLNVLDFLPAIEWLVEDIRRLYEIEASTSIKTCKMPLREETQAFLFRSLRELLINVAKHASVKSADISIRCHEGQTLCAVRDAGCGFDPAPVLHSARGRLSYGLRSINERIQTLGGTLRIDSQPGKGTTVTLTLPCDKLTEECTQP
ncbi:MAG: PAS domain-containing protein [Rhodocyclaceae bacterium]|nr:PAS domain-containing protein [Rhodocyclaceae bacterium]